MNPCDMMVSCLSCIKTGFIFAELASNGSECCCKDFYAVTEPVTFVTNNPTDCPPNDDGIQAMTYGVTTTILLLVGLCLFLIVFYKRIRNRCVGYNIVDSSQAEDEDVSSGYDEDRSSGSAGSVSTTDDED